MSKFDRDSKDWREQIVTADYKKRWSRVHKVSLFLTFFRCYCCSGQCDSIFRVICCCFLWRSWSFQHLPSMQVTQCQRTRSQLPVSFRCIEAVFPNESRLSPSPAAGGWPGVLDGPCSLHWPRSSAPLWWKLPHRPAWPWLLQARSWCQLWLLLTQDWVCRLVWHLPCSRIAHPTFSLHSHLWDITPPLTPHPHTQTLPLVNKQTFEAADLHEIRFKSDVLTLFYSLL